MTEPLIRILVATYNGQTYVRKQIHSLLEQDYPNIQIVLSDDCSTDDTPNILAQYASSYPDKVIYYKSGKRFGNAGSHFLHLLSVYQDAPYIMFCDQDDVWHPDKVRKTWNTMRQMETDAAVPTLMHTDLRVVDENLAQLNASFWNHSNIDGDRVALNQLLVQNVVTGCTMMLNRSLAVLSCENMPESGIIMHDWWIALIAAACGQIGCLHEATIDYRQHSSNSVGAKNVRSLSYLWTRLRSKPMRDMLRKAAEQGRLLLLLYGDRIQAEKKQLLNAFAETKDMSLLPRDLVYVRYGLLKNGVIRKIVQLIGW